MLPIHMDPYRELQYCATSASESEFWYFLTDRYKSIRHIRDQFRQLEEDFEIAIQTAIALNERHINVVKQMISTSTDFVVFSSQFDLTCAYGPGFYRCLESFLDEVPQRVDSIRAGSDLNTTLSFAIDIRNRLEFKECDTKLMDICFVANQRVNKLDFMR